MKGLFWVLALFGLAVAVALGARLNDGYVLLVFPPYRAEVSLNLFVLALLGAYSRLYLSQHFFEDIYAGSFVGLIAALTAHRLVVVRRSKSTALESTEIAETEPEL